MARSRWFFGGDCRIRWTWCGRALTEPKHVEQWFSPAEIDGREGGRAWFAGPKDRPVSGSILVWDPPRVEGETTLLTIRHSRFDPDHMRGYLPGLHAYVDRLEAHLAGAEVAEWQPLAMSYWDTYNG